MSNAAQLNQSDGAGILRFYPTCYPEIGASGLIGHRGPKLWDSKEAAETPDTFPAADMMAMDGGSVQEGHFLATVHSSF